LLRALLARGTRLFVRYYLANEKRYKKKMKIIDRFAVFLSTNRTESNNVSTLWLHERRTTTIIIIIINIIITHHHDEIAY
jgi:hypothetical protein